MTDSASIAVLTHHGQTTRQFGLRLVFALFFVFIVIVSVFSVTFVTYLNARDLIRNEIRSRLIVAASAAALTIDVENHSNITFGDTPNEAAAEELNRQLRRIQRSIPDSRFVYTFRLNSENKVAFVGDSDESENKSTIGEVFEDETPIMRQAFYPGGKADAETEVATDRWGTWLSGYAPLVHPTRHTIEGIVGIDMSADRVAALENRYLTVGLVSSVGVSLVLFPLLLLIIRALTGPLLKAVSELQRIKNFDLNEAVHIKTLIREMNDLKNALEGTRIGLRSFRKYIRTSLASEVVSQQQEAHASAKKRELTIMFTDFKDFTNYSERVPPDELVHLLNRYFEAISVTISEHEGTVDKFIGDSVMAFWNAPDLVDNHPEKACAAAWSILSKVQAINTERRAAGLVGLDIRIGIHTGTAMVGNIGHEGRLSYTAMGDAVNLASRLESLNKQYGSSILLSAATAERLGAEFQTRHMDDAVLKGKSHAVGVFELSGVGPTRTQDRLAFGLNGPQQRQAS